MLAEIEVGSADPLDPQVAVLLAAHGAFARGATPAAFARPLDVDALGDPTLTVICARRDGQVLGVGALRLLDHTHGELKSMHTAAAARSQGVARAILEHLIEVARTRGCTRVSLETGTTPPFAPARRLYEAFGFVATEPFNGYPASPHTAFYTLALTPQE